MTRLMLLLMSLIVLGPLCPHAGAQDGDIGKLLIGCYRYIPGDGTGIFRAAGDRRTLTRVVGGGGWPVWSPDRTQFAYLMNDVIWIADLEGGRRGDRMGVPIRAGKGSLVWSADGRHVVFTYEWPIWSGTRSWIARADAGSIGLRNFRGRETLWVPLPDAEDVGSTVDFFARDVDADAPAVSPDGRYLAWREYNHSRHESTICWAPWDELSWLPEDFDDDDVARGPMDMRSVSRGPSVAGRGLGRPHWCPASRRIAFDMPSDPAGTQTSAVYDTETGETVVIHLLLARGQADDDHTSFMAWLGQDECLIGWGGIQGVPRALYRHSLTRNSSERLGMGWALWDFAVSPDRTMLAVISGPEPEPGALHFHTNMSAFLIRLSDDLTRDDLPDLYDTLELDLFDVRDRPLIPYCLAW